MDKYRHYFEIDPDYFPAVNADVIKHNPDLWKKFYPHSTFVDLLKDTIKVLTRTQKLNIWVEGAYGTGKSHAVLTLKRLLDASEKETTEYFQKFSLDNDLLNKFVSAKNQGKTLTVHRYGSSSIYNDNDLFLAIQESIEETLKEAGITNQASITMKDAVIKYLSDEENKSSFSVYVKGSYKNLFAGASVDDILHNLSTFSGVPLQDLMSKIFRVAHEKQIKAFTLDDKSLCAWIKEVISVNKLNSIVFLWDEFTEYFKNNLDTQTGFQSILELSETTPFFFILVTHRSEALLADPSQKSKVLGRFIRPTRIIELPENMAFELMGAAMQKKNDNWLRQEWDEIIDDLCERTVESRKIVKNVAKIDDSTLQGVLPIHPYTACLLKHISTSFESNQRSMFDFIKNENGGENKGFCWFIDNYGPFDENPLLTIDMLWGFFYEMGKESLAQSIRMILDHYPRLSASKKMSAEEERVLKVILLMQAMSLEVNDAIDIFLATEKNVSNVFEGSDLENEAIKCAEKLVRDNIIYKKPMGADKFVYSILTAEWDSNKINDSKKKFETTSTSTLLTEGSISEFYEFTDALRLRYKAYHATIGDFDNTALKAKSELEESNKIPVVFVYAKDDQEAAILSQKIAEFRTKYPDSSVVIVSTTKTTLGKQKFDEWVGYKAESSLFTGKDNQQAQYYGNYASGILKDWKLNISKGQFELYSKELANAEYHPTLDSLIDALRQITVKRYPLCLDQFAVNNNLWICTTLKQGVESALAEELKGVYNSGNATNKLNVLLSSVWQKPLYWESLPSHHISKIKIALNQLVDQRLDKNGRISIQEIYDFLKPAPYGFMPCNFTAFMVGFLMKEYVKSGSFSYSDDISSEELTGNKFQDMVEEIIKLDNTPNLRYRQKYIVAVTPEEKAFFNSTSQAFDISRQYCTSVENTRTYIRNKMKELAFPLWTLKYAIDVENDTADKEDICKLLELYCNLANNVRETSGKSDNDIAMEIGKIILANNKLTEQISNILTKDNCTHGMELYLQNYHSELLEVAASIKDGGQYINLLRDKFDADAANWVWKQDTAISKIKELICEYRIAKATSDLFQSPCKSYKEALELWSSRCSNMHLAYNVIKSHASQLRDLLERLYYLSKFPATTLTPIQNDAFLQEILHQGNEFLALYANQTDYFKKACSVLLFELADNDKDNVYSKLPSNCFTMDESDYTSRVASIVKEYLQQLDSIRLRNLWKEKTQTDSPRAWSEKYKVPLQIMLTEEEWSDNKKYFDCINSSSNDSVIIKKALSYFEFFTAWNSLNDATARDNAFRTFIIEDRSILLDDIESIKNYLADHLYLEVYDWCQSSSLRTKLDEMFKNKYMKDGYNKAFAKIDIMNPDEAKQYLKELIKTNARVGVEIIRSK